MYSEIGFIFNPSVTSPSGLTNKGNTGSIYGRTLKIRKKPVTQPSTNVNPQTNQPIIDGKSNTPTNVASSNTDTPESREVDAVLVYKDPNERNIPNYLKKSVYREDSDEDPYIALIRNFDKFKPLRFRMADFAYLRDLGVYPLNRLWVLRRFPDNVIVPNNLLGWSEHGVEPIATVVGWIKNREDSEFLTVRFNEVWTDQNMMLDKLFAEIMKEEFGMNQSAFVPVPGWSQAILFGILNQMGLTQDFDYKNIPTGDPNVLRVAKMRDINGQGLISSFNVTLETAYEQKYINGIDPGSAMLDIISNLTKMGTSDQKFILGNSVALQNLISGISNPQVDTWLKLGQQLLTSFIDGLQRFVNEVINGPKAGISGTEGGSSSSTTETTGASGTSGTSGTSESGGGMPGFKQPEVNFGLIKGALANISEVLLAGTISKYRWPLKGSIGLMSGMNTTPWHLTIGNPESPILNIGNVVVKDVEIKMSNDLGFNDMPASINVLIQVDQGRPLGRSELDRMFNNGYKRLYATGSEITPVISDATKSGNTGSEIETGSKKANGG